METIQDLLDPANDNITIVEDPKTGDVSLPGATLVEIRDQQSFVELLRLGEAHRIAANTKMNTESSRSHAILMARISFSLCSNVYVSTSCGITFDVCLNLLMQVHVKRSVGGGDDAFSSETDSSSHLVKPMKPLVRKSKLVLVDLAGSERVHKSGLYQNL